MSLLVIAHLSSPLAGDAPMLDGLLEFEMSQRLGAAYKVRRDQPAPPAGAIHIPMLRRGIGGWSVPLCSSPIYTAESDRHEYIGKRLAVEHASDLREDARLVVAMGNATYKSYRLPLRVRNVSRVAWFCEGHRSPILKLLKSVHAIGRKRSDGYGRVARWTGENVDGNHHWYGESEHGPVLMRPLPFGDWLPRSLLGAKRDFGAVVAPYWHPDRYAEIVVPC